jgi:hypothetical protein
MNKKGIAVGLLTLGGIPLIIYPFILLAGVMSLAGSPSGASVLLTLVVFLFLIGSIAYPAVYFPCLIVSKKEWKKEDGIHLKYSAVPLIYLCGLAILMSLWMMLDQS